MAQKEVSIEDYTVDRKYASHITLEEFIRRVIRSHAGTETEEPCTGNKKTSGNEEDSEP